MKKLTSYLVFIMITTACGYEKENFQEPAPETTLTITQGTVVGLVAENGAHIWRGLPFAASTAGANRWRAPQPPPSWAGTREAVHFAHRCAQLTNEYDEDEGLEPGLVIGSEDCLTLDIYAPPNARSKTLPVMVWIHGGGNVWGRSSSYDGSRLAKNEDVIVVAVQYRLGPFGWFAHEALRERAENREDAAASFAILDIIASLKWVQSNIAAFGGDSSNVSIFGESAGGHNVAALLASPLARGLFHRAIIHSGSFDSMSIHEAQGDVGKRMNTSKEVGGKLNAMTAEALRAISAKNLLSVYTRGRGFLDAPRMIEDGVVLPLTPLREAFASASTFNAVPIITGTTRDEMKLFYFGNDQMTKKRLGFLVVAQDQDFYDALTHYISRLWRIRSVDEPAQMMAGAGHETVYAYRFDWDDGGQLLFMDFKKLLGAAHGFDLPFLFNRFEHLGDADAILFKKATRADRERLSRAMGGYWASFARDGVPSYVGAPKWPQYGANGASFLRLDTDNDGGIRVVNRADNLDPLIDDLMGDPNLDENERCLIVSEMGKWLFASSILDYIQAATGCE